METSNHDAVLAALEASTVANRATLEATIDSRQAALVASEASAQAIAAARSKNWWQMTAQLFVWVVLVLLAYGTVNTRLQVLEVKYDLISKDISEMRLDIKVLLRLQQAEK